MTPQIKLINNIGNSIEIPNELDIKASTYMSDNIAAGVLAVALADWKEAYMIVDRLGITIQRDPFTVKPMVEFYTRKRVGGDVVNYQAIKLGNIAV